MTDINSLYSSIQRDILDACHSGQGFGLYEFVRATVDGEDTMVVVVDGLTYIAVPMSAWTVGTDFLSPSNTLVPTHTHCITSTSMSSLRFIGRTENVTFTRPEDSGDHAGFDTVKLNMAKPYDHSNDLSYVIMTIDGTIDGYGHRFSRLPYGSTPPAVLDGTRDVTTDYPACDDVRPVAFLCYDSAEDADANYEFVNASALKPFKALALSGGLVYSLTHKYIIITDKSSGKCLGAVRIRQSV